MLYYALDSNLKTITLVESYKIFDTVVSLHCNMHTIIIISYKHLNLLRFPPSMT